MAGLMNWRAAPGTNPGDGHTIDTGARFGTPTPNNNANGGATQSNSAQDQEEEEDDDNGDNSDNSSDEDGDSDGDEEEQDDGGDVGANANDDDDERVGGDAAATTPTIAQGAGSVRGAGAGGARGVGVGGVAAARGAGGARGARGARGMGAGGTRGAGGMRGVAAAAARGAGGARGARGFARGGASDQLPMAQGRALKGRSCPISCGVGDTMDIDNDVIVPPGESRVVHSQSQAIDTGVIPLYANSSVDRGITYTLSADPRSEALALEVFSLMQDDGAMAKCSSCLDFGQLKKCERQGCTYALCFWKSNMQPCYSVVAQGAYIADKIYTRRPLVFHTIALELDTYPERTCVRDALALVKAKSEADFLILIDTHSDYENGELVHSVDKHGNVWTQDASEVFCHHFGPELWKWSLDMTGIKGMILLACGPAFTQPSHFEKIKSLVSSKHLQFIIRFTAHSVQPSVVMPFMLQMIIEVYIHQKPVQLALEQEIANWMLLSHTPVVLVCWNTEGCLVSQRYMASTPFGCVWGLSPRCGNQLCNPKPGDINAK
ncbi:uncharacterized protein F5147DRAFT_652975 [Suillus discolor]|uniref:Uncharacterized protein n=1 Tax=Suillus discolor TaxID=1912936 RepID=A0A9P7F5Z6_9AGAM|nr:uncharacterized protein F5147DRAFT_652975 [Suillus discolor]KAG2108257.1 hypothetical protein F5147DRAFT_652975 [Suillus discolor]